MIADMNIVQIISVAVKGWFGLLGPTFIISVSYGSTTNVIAAARSMNNSIVMICIGAKRTGNLKSTGINIIKTRVTLMVR